MKIEKYTKLSNGMYKIVLDDKRTFKLHEDLILKYNLLINKVVDDDLLLSLEKENIIYDAYNIALKYIKTKLRSEKEIRDNLTNKEVSSERINEVILLLRNQGYLNDDVYIKSYINDRIYLSSDGPLKIKKDLLEKGFSEEVINEYLYIFTEDMEKERIDKIIIKYSKNNQKSLFQLKMKLKTLLSSLGYRTDLINSSLNNIRVNEEELKQREYDKLYKKYSKKYSGSELEYKIKQSLYMKGFR